MIHTYLSAVRAAHVERVEAGHERGLRRGIPDGTHNIPGSLICAGLWLVHNGYDGDACPAEKSAGWGPRRYRQYLDTLNAKALAEELEEGRKALFEGRNAIFPAQAMQVAA